METHSASSLVCHFFYLDQKTMSCKNAFVHDLHHCTKLQLSTRCSFGVMIQTRHKFPEIQSGKSVYTGICTIVNQNLHIAI